MSGITHFVDLGMYWYPAISVEANLRSRLRRSQNRTEMQKFFEGTVSVEANLRSRLRHSQNRRIQKGLPV